MTDDVLMKIADDFINATISRLSSGSCEMVNLYFVDLRAVFSDRQRITQNLVENAIRVFNSRGLGVVVNGPTLNVTVDLNRCYLSHQQSLDFSTALTHARVVLGCNI